MEPAWVEHAIWWHVYPLGFVGAERSSDGVDVTHRLGRLTDWFDYAQELGTSGIALGPVFASATHGYDTLDYFRIDPRLGDGNDFAELVAAAHDRGLRVLLDGVFNHAAPGYVEPRMLRPDGASFEGHPGLVTLDHDDPAVSDLVVEVMCHWLAAGADGWRLDAAYAVPTGFWARVLPRVRERHPDVYVVGEVIHGDYTAIVHDSGMDAVTQYELWKATWSAINDRNLFELAHALERHDELPFAPLTFVGNHDVTRIASRIDDGRHLPHALALLFTVAGTPSVYYGDEQAFRGTKEEREGGDDEVRPEFPASPDELSPLGAETFRLHQELIGLRRRHPWLHRAHSSPVHLTNTRLVLALERDGQRLELALNLDDAPLAHDGVAEVLAGDAHLDGSRATVPPHGWAVFG